MSELQSIKVGFLKTSFIDYPGKISSVIFFPYCNLKCPWCHNSHLVHPEKVKQESLVPLSEVFNLLEKRKKHITNVVITGGEPTLYKELPEIITQLKAFGFFVKLDTNGQNSEMIETLCSSEITKPDYIALDFKVPFFRYNELSMNIDTYLKVVTTIKQARIPFEYRTLIFPNEYLAKKDIEEMSNFVGGDIPWYFSAFKPGTCLHPEWNTLSGTPKELIEPIVMELQQLGYQAFLR
ncbi:MAG TPA: anaerobic ribonucleoside-triphosphate reductase activating protein [Methanofastidiosum sp.]|mgnify:CR=1 FL=1|nr:anaerobic ribonucleoside-triphosphate reductase activating protein [Methanofastidiosum sp.]